MSITILHITDIHTGKGELISEDRKVDIPGSERQKQLGRLGEYLNALPNPPDFVVVSGDITIRGDRNGLETFRKWLTEMSMQRVLPGPERIFLAPGNHDVVRQSRESEDPRNRFKDFWEVLCTTYPHAHVPNWDPELDAEALKIPKAANRRKGILGGLVKDKQYAFQNKESHPFLLDLDRDVLIFAFNSALACGVPLPPDQKIMKPLLALQSLTESQAAPHGKVNEVIEKYLDSLVIDAGMVGDNQIQYFVKLMARLRRELGGQFERLTKIAFLHHHVSHLWNQQLELKSFESVVDAASLKQAMVSNGFDFVLHGHKHANHVGIDSALIPISDKSPFTPLCIISGGTVGGNPSINDKQSFKLLRLEGNNGPRVRATVTEIAILESTNYSASLNDARIFHAPISQKLPQLHDIPEVKYALDQRLVDELAPELLQGTTSFDVSIGSSLSHLVSSALRYKCHASFEDAHSRNFYEIILATKRLGFGDKARIYWLLNDVNSMLAIQGIKKKVVVLIGSLGGTHFSQAAETNEISESIEKLSEHFEPAITGGILEIRVHTFIQSEVELIAREAVKGT
ncbi:metallophosphoesterase family protein [Pseudomonas pergaminensis]|uniref:metallophosphoesterase family protein n=1 Tax=Pseudomonas sp. P7779 TaxID=2738832 RepID=UPI0015BA3C04|nr:metallophosphoesterase [Pseudomonas sp. P7779]